MPFTVIPASVRGPLRSSNFCLNFAPPAPLVDAASIPFFMANKTPTPAANPSAINPAGLAKNPSIAPPIEITALTTPDIMPGNANKPPFKARNIPPTTATDLIIVFLIFLNVSVSPDISA